jgi:uncharacterized phage protein (TIGR02218 family)
MSGKDDLIAHMKTGATTTCRAWSVTRKDGQHYGFTDHDRDLVFEGITFRANTGMTAGAVQQSLGLAVNNTEVVGALSDAAISEADIASGRFDGAAVVTYLVNWANVDQRSIRFRGTIGEIRWGEGKFTAELRGMTDVLNRASGRVYQSSCPAVLGDSECRFNLDQLQFHVETSIKERGSFGVYFIASQPSFPDRWFERGQVRITSGVGKGIAAQVKFDYEESGLRRIELWQDFDVLPGLGDTIRLDAGCDKLEGTCRTKFNNFLNFRGFPHIPSADWMTSYPVAGQLNDGGSRVK